MYWPTEWTLIHHCICQLVLRFDLVCNDILKKNSINFIQFLLQILDPFGNGLCFYLLDMLCFEKRVRDSCIDEVAFSRIRKTASRSVYSKFEPFVSSN